MIRNARDNDFDDIYQIINDAAIAYKGIIPEDRWQEPYMSKQDLKLQLNEGVQFRCFVDDDNEIVGVMGIQDMTDVDLVRHAYVRTQKRNGGVGSHLINELISFSTKPILIGTWKAATWAISFYEKHGFQLVPDIEKNNLLKKYWNIPDRQIETSIVLADLNYRNTR